MRIITTLTLLLSSAMVGAADSNKSVEPTPVQRYCTGCHLPEANGALSRISYQRKTPEGWEMTISRMQLIHKLNISNTDTTTSNEVKHSLVKYLADHQGLAPSEAADYRYLIEQRPNVVESFDQNLAEMCGRCHTSARFALQRRDRDEWEKLVHYHLGQYPSTEYSLFGRDRDWMALALNEVVPELARRYPLDTQAWRDWLIQDRANYSGRWLARGYLPGKGQFSGSMTVEGGDDDHYRLQLQGQFENGEPLQSSGNAIVYTGYEWRATLRAGNLSWRQVLAADIRGNTLTGRQYPSGEPEVGMDLELIRDDGQPMLASVSPASVRVGEKIQLRLHGANLQGKLKIPPGMHLISIDETSSDQVLATVRILPSATTRRVDVALGKAVLPGALAVYRKIDQLKITPDYAVARVGGNGGATSRVPALFLARGIDFGEDGAPGGGDDLSLNLNTVKWRVEPFTEAAKEDRDTHFTGSMDKQLGLFTPAAAGPNPERQMSTNNAGDLRVVAEYDEQGNTLHGEAHLIVTVQRWNSPPLK